MVVFHYSRALLDTNISSAISHVDVFGLTEVSALHMIEAIRLIYYTEAQIYYRIPPEIFSSHLYFHSMADLNVVNERHYNKRNKF